MPKWIGRIICRFKGHKRGRYSPTEDDMVFNVRTYACPRCGAQWTRNVSKRKPKKGASDGQAI